MLHRLLVVGALAAAAVTSAAACGDDKVAAQQAVEFVGMPEARIPLAHATAYMCRSAKSREAYESLNAATEKIEAEQTKAVPEELKNKHFPVNPE